MMNMNGTALVLTGVRTSEPWKCLVRTVDRKPKGKRAPWGYSTEKDLRAHILQRQL